MTELMALLARHAARYPAMEPRDAVKLLYQRAFGCGHLLADEAAALEFLEEECAQAVPLPADHLLEDIGGGQLRVHLGALSAAWLTPERLGEAFVRSAARPGTSDTFDADLRTLEANAALFRFPSAALTEFLAAYRADGCPAVHHSAAYRALYRPAYRVVRADVFRETCPDVPFVLY